MITDSSNPFTQYYAEILRAEGLNEFALADIGSVTAGMLASYDVAILGEMTAPAAQVAAFTGWVDGGGDLIAEVQGVPFGQRANALGERAENLAGG